MGRERHGRRPALAGLAALVLCLFGCAALPGSTPPEPVPPPAGLPSPAEAARLLTALPTVARHDAGTPAYDRDAFGSAWADTDGNGCNQRDDVLLRDAQPGTTTTARQGTCDHDVLAGTWTDPYSGRTHTLDDLKDPSQAQSVQIDHVVPLAEAWASGAHAWGEKRRRAYANDLDALLAVDGPTNASKGADDPAAWRPRKAYQCAYALRWIAVKHTWRLGADASERRALGEMLELCPAPAPEQD